MTMYDMTRVNANGYFDSEDSEQARFEKKKAMNAQRTEDYRGGTYALAGGVVDPLPEDAPQFVKDYYAYYKNARGYHPRSLNSNGGWNVTSSLSFLNMPILQYSSEIRSAVLLVHGEKAHSRYSQRNSVQQADRAITRNCSLSPVQITLTFTIRWTSFRLKSSTHSLRSI